MKQYTKTFIVVTLQIEGLHNWPDAKTIAPEVAFLSDLHRHIFHITAKKQVTHADRDIEIIMFKREIIQHIEKKYFKGSINMCNFGARSCEMIAEEILTEFKCSSVQVLEDNENGSEVIAI